MGRDATVVSDTPTAGLLRDPAAMDQMHDEALALVTAWADRGSSPLASAIVLAGFSHAVLHDLGVELLDVLNMVIRSWDKR